MADVEPVTGNITVDDGKQRTTAETPEAGRIGFIGLNDKPGKLKAWQEPGAQGSTLRFLRTLQAYIWDSPDKSTEEKRFLLKLDFFVLTYGCYGYFCKNLAEANISNAYVSGMKEALNMGGSELTFM